MSLRLKLGCRAMTEAFGALGHFFERAGEDAPLGRASHVHPGVLARRCLCVSGGWLMVKLDREGTPILEAGIACCFDTDVTRAWR